MSLKPFQGGIYTAYAPATLKDWPLYSHRGINLDVARHFYPVRSIKHLIDGMSMNKLNILHLHITDSQSWPLEITALPELAKKGAYHKGLVYTAKDLADLQRHGALMGVEVYIEIDMPGHTASVYHAFPDLIASFNVQPDWMGMAAEPPSGTLKLNSSKVLEFLDTVIGDVLPRTKPFTKYFHTGGDEINRSAYKNDETVRTTEQIALAKHLEVMVNRTHSQVKTSNNL